MYNVDRRKENISQSERETLKHTKARYKALTLVLNVNSFVIFNFYKTKCYSVRFYVFDIRCTEFEIIFMFDGISSSTEKKVKSTHPSFTSVWNSKERKTTLYFPLFCCFLTYSLLIDKWTLVCPDPIFYSAPSCLRINFVLTSLVVRILFKRFCICFHLPDVC